MIAAHGEARVEDITEFFGLEFLEVSDTIAKLEQDYVLTSRRVHRSLYYSLNPTWYFFTELKSLLLKIISCMPYEEQQRLLTNQERSSFK